jgi:hypothetical protein
VVANRTAGGPDGGERVHDVSRATQAEPEVHDATGLAGPARLALEDEHVAAARRLSLHEVPLFADRDDAEDRLIEGEGTLWIANGQRYVREAVRLHGWIAPHDDSSGRLAHRPFGPDACLRAISDRIARTLVCRLSLPIVRTRRVVIPRTVPPLRIPVHAGDAACCLIGSSIQRPAALGRE